MKKSGNFKYNFSYFDTIEKSKGNFLGNIGTKIDRLLIGYIILLLSGSNTVYQAKSSLRLLTSMVTFHHQTAREVMSKLDFEHKHWESISKRTNSREIREAFVQFLLSFFIINHPGVAKDFLEKKNLLASIFPGLTKDDAQLVQLILTSFKEKVLENSALSKTSKMKLFSVHNLKYVLRLYDDWTGAYVVADLESDEYLQNKVDVIEVVNDFLLAACTSSKHGLVFQDPSYGTSGSNMNHLLLNFLHSMAEPWTNPTLANLVIRSLSTCPDQIRPYFSKTIQPLWQPRASPAWYQVIGKLKFASVLTVIFSTTKINLPLQISCMPFYKAWTWTRSWTMFNTLKCKSQSFVISL